MKRNSKKAAKEDAALKALCKRHELLKNEEDFFVKRPDGSVVSPIVIVNEKFNTSAQYEEPIKNKNDCIFQTVLKINGVIKATGLGYNVKISKIQAAFEFYSSNENDSPRDLGNTMKRMKLSSSQEHQTDNNSSDSLSGGKVQMPRVQTPKYVDDCYSTEKKVCLVVVVTEFKSPGWNRDNADNDAKLATNTLELRGFEVIKLVGSVTKRDFTKQLDLIKKRKDIDLFMLVVSSHGDENDNVMFSDNETWEDKDSRLVLLVIFKKSAYLFKEEQGVNPDKGTDSRKLLSKEKTKSVGVTTLSWKG